MKLKTAILITSTLFLINNLLLSQNQDEKYKSSSEIAYYDSLQNANRFGSFELVSIDIAKKIPYDFITIDKIESLALYNPNQIFSEFWDSTSQANKDILTDPIKFSKLMQEMQNQKIGPVSRMSIIKEQRIKNKWAILYTDSKYDDFIYGGWGYWIALSNNSGKTWDNYYTGLTENNYYFFKRNSTIPLWKDSATIQIEGAIVRQKSPVMHPIPAEIEVIEDGIAVQINLEGILKDSDNDGLTDVSEQKMLLNPYNSDTDGDGITDFFDRNPRFKSRKSSKTLIYETLLDGFYPNKRGVMEIDTVNPDPIRKKRKDQMLFDFETVNLLVTDDPIIQQLNPKLKTVIILTSEEYSKYQKKYPSHFIKCSYTPMFKCDNFDDTFLIETSELTGGATYLIQKTKKGWKISELSSWIS